MRKSVKRSQKNRIASNYLGMIAISFIVLILLIGLVIQGQGLKGRLAVYEARAAALEQEIEDEENRTEEIEELKEYMQTDEYAEEIARNRLGLVKDNEIVFQEDNS